MLALTVRVAVAAASIGLAAPAPAQGPLVYRLGRDTVAVEQYTRTATRLAGEAVTRSGPAVVLTQYEVNLNGGLPTSAVVRRRQPDGSTLPNTPHEWRFTFTADSVRRDVVWSDSVQSRTFAAARALLVLPVPTFGHTELMVLAGRRPGTRTDSLVGIGTAGNPTVVGLARVGGDTVRMVGGPYPMLLRFDADARLLSVDGSLTTNKIVGTRGTTSVDVAALARRMTPTGALSARGTARATLRTGGILLVDYGRPMVRDRTVWGGTLVPYDSVWRTGANDATHLATTRDLVFGDVVVPAGVYTLWIQHTRTGTTLLVSRQIGVWGTMFDANQVFARIPLHLRPAASFVEEFTIEIRAPRTKPWRAGLRLGAVGGERRVHHAMTAPDVRYPIGRFQRPSQWSDTDRGAAIAAIAALPAELAQAVAGLTPAQLDTPYRTGGWSPRQIVHHLADSHMNAFVRVRLALTEDTPTVKPYNQEEWARLADVRAVSPDVSLRLIEALHTRWVALLRSLAPADFARRFNHPESGVQTIDSLIALYAWHGRHHTAHITTLHSR